MKENNNDIKYEDDIDLNEEEVKDEINEEDSQNNKNEEEPEKEIDEAEIYRKWDELKDYYDDEDFQYDENLVRSKFKPDENALNQAIENAKKEREEELDKEHKAQIDSDKQKKETYDKDNALIMEVKQLDGLILETETRLEPYNNKKKNIDDDYNNLQVKLNVLKERKAKISTAKIKFAQENLERHAQEEYEFKQKKHAEIEKAAEKAKNQFENEFVADKLNELLEEFENEKKEKNKILDEVENYDRKKWQNFLKQKKDEGADVKRYNKSQRSDYNKELSEAVEKIKKKSVEDILSLDIRKGYAQGLFDPYTMNDKDIRDADQEFDRFFMELHAFYCKNNTGESILNNIIFEDGELPDLDREISEQLKGKSLLEVAKTLPKYDREGNKEKLEGEKLEQFAKAIFLHSIIFGQSKFKFVPKFFADLDSKKLSSAENETALCLTTDDIRFKNKNKEELKPEFDELHGRYKRIKADEMIKSFPVYKVPVLDPISEEEEKEPEEENNIKSEDDADNSGLNDSIESFIIKKKNDNNVEEKLDDDSVNDEEFNAINDNLPKMEDGKVCITSLEFYCKGILNLLHNIPDKVSREKIERLQELMEKAEAKGDEKRDDIIEKRFPNGVILKYSDDPEVLKAYGRAYYYASSIPDEIDKYLEEESSDPYIQANCEYYNVIKNNEIIMDGEGFQEYIKADPTYFKSMQSLTDAFPYNSFWDEKKKIFEPHDSTYGVMMKDIPFVSQMKRRQTFLMENYKTYYEKKNNINGYHNKIDDKSLTKFREKYIDNLEYIQENTKKINNYKEGVFGYWYIKNAEAFADENIHKFTSNWQDAGEDILTITKRQFAAIDRGWPAEDIAFIVEMYNVEKELKAFSRGELDVNPQQQELAKKILKKMNTPLNKLKNSIVTSVEMRDDIIDDLKRPIEEYVALRKNVLTVNIYTNLLEKPYGTPAIEALYADANLREVKPAEMEFKHHRIVEDGFEKYPGLTFKQIKDNIDIMVKELNAVEIKISGSSEFKEMKESLLGLKTYADVNLVNDPEKPLTQNEMSDKLTNFRDEMIKTTVKIKKYLARKQRQFNENHDRREREGKQTVEQSRIKMAINMQEKIYFLDDMIEEYEKDTAEKKTFMKTVKNICEERSQQLADKVNEGVDAVGASRNKKQYLLGIAKILFYTRQVAPDYYEPFEDETFADFKTRMQDVGVREITQADIDNMMKTDRHFRETMQRESENYNSRTSKNKDYKTFAENYYNLYKKPVQKVGDKVVTRKEKNAETIKNYRDNLVSDFKRQERANKRDAKNQQKAEKPKGRHI